MPARLATSSTVARRYPVSRMSSRAASRSVARVRCLGRSGSVVHARRLLGFRPDAHRPQPAAASRDAGDDDVESVDAAPTRHDAHARTADCCRRPWLRDGRGGRYRSRDCRSAPVPGRCENIGWPGAYDSWWQADPNDRRVLIFLSHNMVELQQIARGIGLGVWEAISRFHLIATS